MRTYHRLQIPYSRLAMTVSDSHDAQCHHPLQGYSETKVALWHLTELPSKTSQLAWPSMLIQSDKTETRYSEPLIAKPSLKRTVSLVYSKPAIVKCWEEYPRHIFSAHWHFIISDISDGTAIPLSQLVTVYLNDAVKVLQRLLCSHNSSYFCKAWQFTTS